MAHKSDHLTRPELEAWRDHGTGDRARIVAHLARCETCRELAADVERARAPGSGPKRFEPAHFTAAGYRAYPSTSAPRVWWRPQWALVAAALVVLALVPLVYNTIREEPADTLRGGLLVLGPPSGPIDTLPVFRWNAGFRAGSFLLEIFDEKDAVVYTTTTRESSLEPSGELRARIGPGTYRWRVTALDAAGSRITTSDPQIFTLRP